MPTNVSNSVFSITTVKVILFFYLCLTFNFYAQNWSMINGNKERTSWASFETELLPPLEKAQEFNFGDGTSSGTSYYSGMLFVSVESDTNNAVVAYNVETGIELWRFYIPETGGSVNVTPAVNDSLVLCGGQNGLGLYSLNRLSGVERWFKPMGTLYSRNPIIDIDKIYVIGDSLYCLNIKDGTTIWSYPFSAFATPVVDNEYIYICGNSTLFVLNKFTGLPGWEIYNSHRNYASFTIDENYIYTSSNDSILALNKTDGSIHWTFVNTFGEIPDLSHNAIAITDSVLCFSVWEDTLQKGQLHTLDKFTGTHLWEYKFDASGVFSPAIANGIVYVINWMGNSVRGFNLITGENVFTDNSEIFLHQPIIADGRLYVECSFRVVSFRNISTGINSSLQIKPAQFELFTNYPNPFNPSTTISFSLPDEGFVKLSICNIQGEETEILINNYLKSGFHEVVFDAKDYASGVYLCTIKTSEFTDTNKLVLVR